MSRVTEHGTSGFGKGKWQSNATLAAYVKKRRQKTKDAKRARRKNRR